jgi:hypothetical protein
MSWKLVAANIPTQIGPYKVESERDGDQTAHLVTLPDNRQVRVLPDDVHSGQYRIRVVKVALEAMTALTADSGSLPAGYDPALYLYGSLCYANLEWEQVWEGPTIEDWLADWFPIDVEVPVSALIRDLNKAGWVVRREDEV